MVVCPKKGRGTCQSRACWVPASPEDESTLKQEAEKQLSVPEKVIPVSEELKSAQWQEAITPFCTAMCFQHFQYPICFA